MAHVIHGTVRDAGGLPVPQARAYFVSGPGSYPDTAAITDEHGEFTLAAQAEGKYGIGCSADDFDSEVTSVELTQTAVAHVEIRLSRPTELRRRIRAISEEETVTYDDVTVTEEEAPEDASEASEAEGVAAIDLPAPELSSEDADVLDRETLEGLEDQAGAEVGEAATALSQNFVLAEFHCCRGHCAHESVPADAVPALRRLVTQVLQPMRDRFGRCVVHSGYRNAAHNQHVGGAPQSHHRYDVRPEAPAADVSFARGSVNEWAAEARRRLGNIGGVGRYPGSGFVHVDLGAFRRWDG